MASSTFGPTSRAALPCQTASSTSLGSNRVSRTEGSSAPTATKTCRTLTCRRPAPTQQQVPLGQSDGDLGAVLVLTDRDRLPQRQRASVHQRPRDRGRVGQGSRRKTTTRAWRALAGSRTTRTSRTARNAAIARPGPPDPAPDPRLAPGPGAAPRPGSAGSGRSEAPDH